MINRRSNVFETNSSSVHTVTLSDNSVNDLKVSKDGYVHLSMGYYGKEFNYFNNSYDKLSYAILTICYTHGIFLDWYDDSEELSEDDYESACSYWIDSLEDLMDTTEYKEVEKCVVSEMTKQGNICYGIKIHQSNCGIDHQSQEYSSLDEFFEQNNIENCYQFIFGNYTLNTTQD